MTNFFVRRGAAYINEMNRSLGSLLGIATGVICDGELRDGEIRFLRDWLTANKAIASSWPGDVIHSRVQAVLADGQITDAERTHLLRTLEKLIGGRLEELAASTHVTELAFDNVDSVEFAGQTFCLTGDFVFASREMCAATIETHGGLVVNSVTKKLRYLVVGGLGSAEWKHGSFGTKLEKGIRYKREGSPILIIHEDHWAACL